MENNSDFSGLKIFLLLYQNITDFLHVGMGVALQTRVHQTTGFNMSKSPKGSPTVAEVTAHDVKAALTGLEFGSVVVTVHHGRIVQIERREKMRLDNNDRSHLSDHTNTQAD